jgi:sugar lactone lactonase YvrE
MVEVEQVGSVVASLGECPVWSGDEQALYWEDIDGRAIHRYDPATDATDTRDLPGRPGSFVLSAKPGRFLVAMETELVWLDWATGLLTPFTVVEDASAGNRLNDGRCDPAGRYVVGTMHPSPEESHFVGSLYSIDRTGAVSLLETEVGVPNGLVFDPDRSRMYWTDTLRHVIWVWDYDLDTGMRRNKRVFFDYDANDDVLGLPDGACLDVDGCYWSASVEGWALIRITPEGTVDRRIDLPVQKPTMPAFGGADLSTLYVTSIGDGNGSENPSGVPAGALLAVDAGVGGLPEPRFAT